MNITQDFATESWPISRPVPYKKNARKWSQKAIEKVAASIREFGWRQPLVCDAEDVIVIGHLRLAAAQFLGLETVPVHVARDLSPAKVRALRLADNRLHEEATWDEGLLREDMLDLKGLDLDLSLTGFSSRELDALTLAPSDKADECPEVPKWAVTKPGDLWLMGEHRLLCGDAVNEGDFGRLMDGQVAVLVLTDPPYGINIVNVKSGKMGGEGGPTPYGGKKGVVVGGKPYGKGKVGFDNLVAAREYFPITGDDKPFDPRPILRMAPEQIIFGANFFASKLPDGKAWITWDKDASGMFSACELAWTSKEGRLRIYRHMWSGLRREGGRDEELTERVHPTQKPVGLFKDILADFTEKCALVLDPYLGSGTTVIAAEVAERVCFGMEIEPMYCDVIVQRWQNFTGREATLEGHGATFAHVRDGRLREWEDAIKEEVLNAQT